MLPGLAQARALGSHFAGVSLGLVHIHLKGALGDVLAGKEHVTCSQRGRP